MQPFLLKCHNPSTVFLPVKSPSPTTVREKTRRSSSPKNYTKEKTRSSSPKSSSGKKYNIERESNLKQRELLPLFDENAHVEYPNLLDDDPLTEEKLETKRVDPTSYSGQVSHDSEDSKSGDTSLETTAQFDSPSYKESISALNSLTLQSNYAISEEHEEIAKLENGILKSDEMISPEPVSNANITKMTDMHTGDEKLDIKSMPNGVYGLKVLSFLEDNGILTKDILLSKLDIERRSTSVVEDNSVVVSVSPRKAETCPKEDVHEVDISSDSSTIEKSGIQVKNDESREDQSTTPPSLQRADALESLLELCARLMKQDKFDELKGVLKPFGDDTVSSRETAIWLTNTLMNTQKFAKES